MPEVLPSAADFGRTADDVLGGAITIGGVAGDQQSALFGQACFKAGMAKNTYGTGCFMLMHTGARLPDLGQRPADHQRRAAQRHAPVCAGRQRVRRRRRGAVAARRPAAIEHSSQVQALAESVPDSGGVMLVPAFTGLGAPYWEPDARGSITGLTRGTAAGPHCARGAGVDRLPKRRPAAGHEPRCRGHRRRAVSELRVDGGACVNDLLMQFQADLLGIPVVRPACVETTALGAAYLAGLSSGVYQSTEELSSLWKAERRFVPTMDKARADELMARWERAVRQTTAP